MKSAKKNYKPCELCNQPVKITGFTLQTTEGGKFFCCEGCLSIYQLLNHNKIVNHNEKKNESL